MEIETSTRSTKRSFVTKLRFVLLVGLSWLGYPKLQPGVQSEALLLLVGLSWLG